MNIEAVIAIAMGKSHKEAVAALLSDISHDLGNASHLTIAVDSNRTSDLSHATAHYLARQINQGRRDSKGAEPTRTVTISQPDNIGARLKTSLGRAQRYKPVALTSPGAKFGSIKVRADIADAPRLLAVSSIGSGDNIGTLAMGVWTKYIDPRLAFVLTLPRHRDPALADVASGVSPSLAGSLLSGYFMGYVVAVWSKDIVAAELGGLAVWTATLPESVERIGPWEDPVVQRATELDLGVQLPSRLALDAVWASDTTDNLGMEMLSSLISTVSSLLNVPTQSTAKFRFGRHP